MRNLKLLFLFVAMIAFGGNAMADNYVFDDFESYEIGTTFKIVQRSSGSDATSSTTYAEVTEDPADASNKVLHVLMKTWNCGVEMTLPDELAGKNLTDKYQTLTFRFRRVSSNNYVQFHACVGSDELYGDSNYPGQGNQDTWVDKSYTLSAASESNVSTSFRFGLHSNESEYYIDDVTFVSTNSAPSITTDLQSEYTVQQNKTLSLSFVAAGTPDPTYQWYSNATASTEGATAIDGATEATYSVPTATIGDTYYYCIATNTMGSAQTAIAKVSVTAPIAVTGITLNYSTLTLNEGNKGTLTATVTPDDAANTNVTWSSSNESVATVADGVVTAVKEGTAVITAKTEDGGYEATCEVTVQKSNSRNGQYLNDGLFLMVEDFEANAQGETATVENANGGVATVVADPNAVSANALNFVTGSYKNTEYVALPITLPTGVKLSDFTNLVFDICYDTSKDNKSKTIYVAIDETSNNVSFSTGTPASTWTTQNISLSGKTTDNNTFTLYIGGMNASVGSFYIDNIRLMTDAYTLISGSDIWWKYDSESGALDIKGTGAIPDFAKSGNIPWNSYRGTGIKTVTIGEGITTIGQNNFYQCSVVTSVSFPTTLTTINASQAFLDNKALTVIDLSNTKVTTIGTSAFQGCNAATSVILPATLESLGDKALYINNANCVVEFHSNPTFATTSVLYAKKYKEANLVLNDSEKPFVSATSDNTYNNVTYNRTTPNGYFTIMLPFVPASTEGITLYELESATDNTVTFKEATTFEANTPYLAKAATTDQSLTAASVTIAAPTAGTATVGNWTFQGTYTAVVKTAEDNAYGFTDTQLVHNTGNMTVNPFRAYMTYSGSGAKAAVNFDFDDAVPTAINALDADLSTMEIYNANGARQSELQKGINIVKFNNGTVKKIIIK